MPKRKEKKPKRGRPTKYASKFDKQAAKLCRLGATDHDLAEFFEVSESTLNLWKLKHPSFSESMKRSKDELDALVEQSLFRRATGYSHRATKFFQAGGAILAKDYVEHYPPDATSMIFWLKNRQPDAWRDKRDGGSDDDDLPPESVEVTVRDARKHADAESSAG